MGWGNAYLSGWLTLPNALPMNIRISRISARLTVQQWRWWATTISSSHWALSPWPPPLLGPVQVTVISRSTKVQLQVACVTRYTEQAQAHHALHVYFAIKCFCYVSHLGGTQSLASAGFLWQCFSLYTSVEQVWVSMDLSRRLGVIRVLLLPLTQLCSGNFMVNPQCIFGVDTV